MSVLILVIPMALVLGAGFLYAFFWATSSGQFDDLTTPSMRMLDQDLKKVKNNKENNL